MEHVLKTFQKRLTNLNSRNRTIFLGKLYKKQFLDIHALDHLLGKPSFFIIEQLLKSNKRFAISELIDNRDEDTNKVSQLLKGIYRTERLIYEERGAKDLYLGALFVEGKLKDGTIIRAPFIFFPVQLQIENGKWYLKRRENVAISFNKTFLLAYSHYNQVPLEKDLIDFDFDRMPTDPKLFLSELYQLLEESGLSIYFSQDILSTRLKTFSDKKKSDIDLIYKFGEVRLKPQAVLGLFPQADSYLMPDYEELLDDGNTRDLEDFFISAEELRNRPGVRETMVRKAQNEEELFTPFAIDASQERILKAVKSGHSLVVQGPPGSGKSQLICNMVADAIGKGKNVLVVCQKKAALDVVYDRLAQEQLSDFVAMISDHRNDRKQTYEKVKHQIDQLEHFQLENNSLDAIFLEREFLKVSREIDQIVEKLQEFKEALFNDNECGKSPKELYLSSNPYKRHIILNGLFDHFHFKNYENFRTKLSTYIDYAIVLEAEFYPWKDRISFKDFDTEDYIKLLEIVREIKPRQQQLSRALKDVLNVEFDLDDCVWLADRKPQVESWLAVLENPQDFALFRKLTASKVTVQELEKIRFRLEKAYGEEGVEATLPQEDLGKWQEILESTLNIFKSWDRRWRWKMFSKEKQAVYRLLEANQLEATEKDIRLLMQRIDNRMNLEHILSKLRKLHEAFDIPKTFELSVLTKCIDNYIEVVRGLELYRELRKALQFLDLNELSYSKIKEKIERAFELVGSIPHLKSHWMHWLGKNQMSRILTGAMPAEDFIEALQRDFDKLCAFDKMKADLYHFEEEVISALEDKLGFFHLEKTVTLFDNSIHLSWVKYLEAKYPILRAVSSGEIEQLEERLQKLTAQKQKLCGDIVLLHARERTYNDVQFNRLNNRVTYRDLYHQVNKKRHVWPLRKLISSFSHELQDLIPCWLASPEAVSALFPLEQYFDLVIFDEASQCYAEKGIPAIYRGKQVVIAGDSQQLQPFDLYRSRWEELDESEEVDFELEVESLLDLGTRYLSQFNLNGHYRSQSADLIAFSNKYFYSNMLQYVPSRQSSTKTSLAYIYLSEGIWEKQRNFLEAQEVVSQVKTLIEEGEKSIGVVTFNYQQQELIRDLLEDAKIALPTELFIKNIENVQGDERDFIIFSIGYAKNTRGTVQANFGTLNRLGGENRLNVAITRARKKICVVSSLLPHELHVDETKHEGPKLLKAYLEYVYDIANGNLKVNDIQLNHTTRYSKSLKDVLQQELEGKSFDLSLSYADLVPNDLESDKVILTDDNLFFDSISVKDAHVYQIDMLKTKGWSCKRFYTRNQWINPDNQRSLLSKFFSE
ncbi:AAA domain-containing protein [Sediminitomix flava]|uniref:AAA domain-containing protein n=1 Tax=Sediminitomix flava TaxID=379075 RepID=A0A315Z5D4_SEDFL|nr:AAA domain-containing protein [Sediminitomix flava]PWJ39118.1 AAA domain-containing protein [Sediminitomix flava]